MQFTQGIRERKRESKKKMHRKWWRVNWFNFSFGWFLLYEFLMGMSCFLQWTNFWNKPCFCFFITTEMHTDRTKIAEETTTQGHSTRMASSASNHQNLPIIFTFVVFSLLVSSSPTVLSEHIEALDYNDSHPLSNQTFRPLEELQKLNRIRHYLRKINKPAFKIIESPDGDVIDCVPSHLQPAFDHPQLKGQKPLEPPERPKGHDSVNVTESFQLWTASGEACLEGTIPIRRTTEKDVLRASSLRRFGRKIQRIRHDTMSSDHEHAVAFVNGDQFYGAKASINVWKPQVTDEYEFSLSQVWIISGTFGNDLNTIEAGWQVSPELYGDNYPRFFTYWTTDAYQATGCYNLLCSGFVQTNSRISIGAAISPTSAYSSRQYDIGVMIWKDPKHGHWWLELGSGLLLGYWPSFLFTHLQSHASMVQFGGEIVNTRSMGFHTSTQMGSGHFADEGFGKASYVRNLQVVDWDNSLIPLSNLHLLADHPSCYDIKAGRNNVWGNYFYYGGPGRNSKCP